MSGAPFEFSIACDAAIISPLLHSLLMREKSGSATHLLQRARQTWQCHASGAREETESPVSPISNFRLQAILASTVAVRCYLVEKRIATLFSESGGFAENQRT